MTTTLIIARHGNTFTADQTPTRVGARTDLPLVPKGLAQGRALGLALLARDLIPDEVFVSRLQRTQQTAHEALAAMKIERPLQQAPMLDEIDYGPDENKPEAEVIARLGAQALLDWDQNAAPPAGWLVDPAAIIRNWQDFAARYAGQEKTVLAVTSNGTARFAPHVTGDFAGAAQRFTLKLSTGAFGVLRWQGERWHVADWNIRPALSV